MKYLFYIITVVVLLVVTLLVVGIQVQKHNYEKECRAKGGVPAPVGFGRCDFPPRTKPPTQG